MLNKKLKVVIRISQIVTIVIICGFMRDSMAAVRIKDLATLSGARDNQLVGYGLVSGLNNQGDRNQIYTLQSLSNMLRKYNLTLPQVNLQSKNVAAVMVSAIIPPFAKPGTKLDVTVSSIGDAKSLQGGVLLQTPLFAADGNVYAVAQGQLTIGGFSSGEGNASLVKNHPTVGKVSNGAIVEEATPTQIELNGMMQLLFRQPDFTTISRAAVAINERFERNPFPVANAVNASTINLTIPSEFWDNHVGFIEVIESLSVIPDNKASVIVNERTGTIVATSSVQISACAISHGNLTISVATTPNVSQPNPLAPASAQTVVTQGTQVNIEEKASRLIPTPDLPTVEEVAQYLNTLGVTPRDMISIFQAMKEAGALHAEIVVQ
jgi:flagellar P-ring protein FlgI